MLAVDPTTSPPSLIASRSICSIGVSLLVVAALQSLVLLWMVWDRVSLLANGREIKAAVVPVDPRDVFRGDYVTLGYGFNTGAESGGDFVFVDWQNGSRNGFDAFLGESVGCWQPWKRLVHPHEPEEPQDFHGAKAQLKRRNEIIV